MKTKMPLRKEKFLTIKNIAIISPNLNRHLRWNSAISSNHLTK